jgi:hypothetical protein
MLGAKCLEMEKEHQWVRVLDAMCLEMVKAGE